jgi:predicted RNA methylase
MKIINKYFRVVTINGPKLERAKKLQNPKQERATSKLKSLDLFSGCGGLTCGLEASGLTECKWAVEMDSKAAKAFAKNFPGCRVYNEDVVAWLQKLKVNHSHRVCKIKNV